MGNRDVTHLAVLTKDSVDLAKDEMLKLIREDLEKEEVCKLVKNFDHWYDVAIRRVFDLFVELSAPAIKFQVVYAPADAQKLTGRYIAAKKEGFQIQYRGDGGYWALIEEGNAKNKYLEVALVWNFETLIPAGFSVKLRSFTPFAFCVTIDEINANIASLIGILEKHFPQLGGRLEKAYTGE